MNTRSHIPLHVHAQVNTQRLSHAAVLGFCRRCVRRLRRSSPSSGALTLALLATLTATLAACGAPGSVAPTPTNTSIVTAEGDFLGTVAGLNAGIAITTDGSNALIYIGDGTPTHVTISTWMQGADTNNILDVTSSTNVQVSALITPTNVSGNVIFTLTSQTYTFTANALTSRGVPGLYRSSLTVGGVDYQGGWYVLPDGASAGSAPTMGGAVVNLQTNALIASPTPDFTALSVAVPSVGTFTLHYCHFGACA
ncbi:MAG TPA: hypothetical protein VMV29_20410 [Ktedonobacterales bacterium]|nr:hypothetical protein [Ktedonobacterales bacterium]